MDAESRKRFEELALPHLGALYQFAMKLTGDRFAAEDLVQDTYLRGLTAFSRLRENDRIRAWLFQIISRLAIDRHRSARREVPLALPEDIDRFSLYDRIWDDDPLPYSDHLHDDFLRQFRDEDIHAALRAIPEVYRVALVLLYATGSRVHVEPENTA